MAGKVGFFSTDVCSFIKIMEEVKTESTNLMCEFEAVMKLIKFSICSLFRKKSTKMIPKIPANFVLA